MTLPHCFLYALRDKSKRADKPAAGLVLVVNKIATLAHFFPCFLSEAIKKLGE